MYTHIYHLGKVTWCTCNHSSVVKWTQSFEIDFCHFFLFKWRTNLSSNFTPSLSVFLKAFSIPLSHGPKLISVGSHIQIVLILFDEGLSKVSKSTNLRTVQVHVPFECSTSQAVLKIMNEQLLIISLS